ncbi:MAG: hypothetical protein DRP60_09150 [Spirochaetes bacterium]|nr:MAG: hypothetical protein DRP60_09150 [Spirochaetota bacterium]
MDNSGTHKEGVGRTYKGCDGYAPIFSYIGEEGYMLGCELRPGTQHCQKGTPEYLKKNLKMIGELAPSKPVLIRMDSGNAKNHRRERWFIRGFLPALTRRPKKTMNYPMSIKFIR